MVLLRVTRGATAGAGLARDSRIRLVASAVVLIAAALFTRDPIPQDPAYHRFADRRSVAGIPNAADVLSNLAFVAVGLAGARFTWGAVRRGAPGFRRRAEAVPWLLLFAAGAATGAGSACYHWEPTDATLLWDRLPLSATCAALLGAAVSERVGLRQGLLALPALAAFGLGSVLAWHWAGDLRYYLALQVGAAVVAPLMVALLPAGWDADRGWYLAAGGYGLAKLAEWQDAALFGWGRLVSGHTCKHLLAAASLAALLWMVRVRRPRAEVCAPPAPGPVRTP